MYKLNEPISILDEPFNSRKIINYFVRNEGVNESFYVCDVDDIIEKFKIWKSLMPRVKPYYAVKCNDHPVVLKVLAALGLGFDCASKVEIDKMLSLDIEQSRIIYAHTTKPRNHLKHAAKCQVKLMTFDNELELHKIKDVFPKARTVIRIRYDDPLADWILGNKFGCDPNTEAPYLLRVAHTLNIKVVGVSFHIGTGSHDPSTFYGAIKASRYVFDVAKMLGYNFDLLDIGGGFPGEMDDAIKEYGDIINRALDEYFSDESIQIISEPGRYFVESAFTLACNVHSKRRLVTQDECSNEKFHYYINSSIFGGLCPVAIVKYRQPPQTLDDYSEGKKFLSTIWGQTMASTDLVIDDILLPELNLEDWLLFPNIGAYSIPLRTQFNGFEAENVYSLISRENWLFLKEKLPLLPQDFTLMAKENSSHLQIERYG